MDAHRLNLPDHAYDIVYGNAILHHLDLQRAIPEVARVLKPDGTAVFRDVMIGNVFLRAFRFATPFWRTPDEHPLTRKDFKSLGETFDIKISQYVLTGLPYMFAVRIINNVILKNIGITSRIQLDKNICRRFDVVDQWLFRYMPFMRNLAWLCLIVLYRRRNVS
jgi:SAM-dependent methyltransferase